MKQIREIRVKDLIIYFWLQLAIIILLWSLCITFCAINLFNIKDIYVVLITLVLNYLPTRYFLIGCVLIYKAFAPMDVRNKCRFTPSCSTYMIMAIKKYGIIIGVFKGVKRLFRCKPPYGGVDFP